MARDPYKYFRIEAREIQEQLVKGILDLEKGADSPELVSKLLRLAHTLKGAARVVRLSEIAGQAHAMVEALTPFRDSRCAVARECIDLLLKYLDEIGIRV